MSLWGNGAGKGTNTFRRRADAEMTVPADHFDAMRTAVHRQLDRVAVLAPEVERALIAAHGPAWARLLADRARAAGRSASGLHDPRYVLRLIAHEPALAKRFDADCRRAARRLAAIVNSVAHTDLARLRPDDDVTAARLADRLVALVPGPLPSDRPPHTTPAIRASRRVPPPPTASPIRAPRRVPSLSARPAVRTPRPVPSRVPGFRTPSPRFRFTPPARPALPPAPPPVGLLPAPPTDDEHLPLGRDGSSKSPLPTETVDARPSTALVPVPAEPPPSSLQERDVAPAGRRGGRAGLLRVGRRGRVCLVATVVGLCGVGLVGERVVATVGQVVASLKLGLTLVPDGMDCMVSWDLVEDAEGAVGCTATDGPYSVRAYYHRFSDPAALRRYFQGRVREARSDGTARLGRPGSCAAPGHVVRYRTTSHRHHGRVLCVRVGDEYRFEWADRTTVIYASATTTDRYGYLYRWWLDRAGPGRYGGQAPPKER